jgi:CBS domain containing-hemolysin-like protein
LKFSFRHSIRWSIFISIATLALAIFFSVASTVVLEGVAWGAGMLVVLVLVLIGVVFDMIGIASAAAEETPFHAMASEKVPGARHAIQIVRNADRFSSFCNDVIGDIVGVVSGTATAVVVIKLVTSAGMENTVWNSVVSVVFSAVVSALMVGGKALGKSFSIHHANKVVFWIGKCFYFLESKLGITILRPKKTKRKKSDGKKGPKRVARTDT